VLTGVNVDDLAVLKELRVEEIMMNGCTFTNVSVLNQLSEFEYLHTLQLKNMGLSAIIKNFKFPAHIRRIDLSWNYFNEFPFTVWPQGLTRLDLTHNNIKSLGTLKLPDTVRLLYLGWNKIAALDGFCAPSQLSTLLLANNELNAINSMVFRNTRLETLGLSRNKITAISMEGMPLSLRAISLADNPIQDFFVRYDDVKHRKGLELKISRENLSEASSVSARLFGVRARFNVACEKLRRWEIAGTIMRAPKESLIGGLPFDLRRVLMTDFVGLYVKS
jgi:hypothetical protein